MQVYPNTDNKIEIYTNRTQNPKYDSEPKVKMASLSRQILVLTKKNWILRKRNLCTSITEIALPVILTLLMVSIVHNHEFLVSKVNKLFVKRKKYPHVKCIVCSVCLSRGIPYLNNI